MVRALALLLILPSLARADVAAPEGPGGGELEVIAALLDDHPSLCDGRERMVPVHYRVIRVVAGSYEGDDLWVGFPCPERPRTPDRFVAGDVHLLFLSPLRISLRVTVQPVVRASRITPQEDDRCGALPSLGPGFLYTDSDGCPDVMIGRGDRATLDARDIEILQRLLWDLVRFPGLTMLEVRGAPKSVDAVYRWLIASGVPRRHLKQVFEDDAGGAWLNPTEWDGRPLPYR
jgi:hypothetical protein